MPKLDGISACKKIKNIYPEIPIVAFTANAEFHSLGVFDEIIHKPFQLDILIEILNKFSIL